MKTNVYIDGFNLYYGRLKSTRYKWLDLWKMCELALSSHTINHVHYFTARITVRNGDVDSPRRQETYLRALRTLPNVSIHYGHFLVSTPFMARFPVPTSGPRTVRVTKTEEKGSDVNLAMHLLLDGFANNCELAVVVSNDSDLTEPIRVMRDKLHRPVGVLNPHDNISYALKGAATFYRPLREGVIAAAQFPDPVVQGSVRITKPLVW